MSLLPAIRELFAHNYWARDRQIEACLKLKEEEFLRPLGGSFPSLRDTLAHLVKVEWVWLERWQGRSPEALPDWDLRTAAAVVECWQPIESAIRERLAALKEEELEAGVTYLNLRGERWTYPLSRILLHLATHQAQHRGQITNMLRQLGVKPPTVDFLAGFDSAFESR